MALPPTPSPSFQLLLGQQSYPQYQGSISAQLQTAGVGPQGQDLQPLPVTAWFDTSFGPYIINVEAFALAGLAANVVAQTNGAYMSTASNPSLQWTALTAAAAGVPLYLVGTSPWVDLQAEQRYNTARGLPNLAILTVQLTAGSGVGPNPIASGALTLTDGNGNYWSNLPLPPTLSATYANAGTVPFQGSIPLAFTCTVAGANGNLPTGTTLSLVTQIPGLSATTVTVAPNASCVVQGGANVESDASVQARCYNQPATQATGSPIGAWQNWCFAASNEVRYATANPTGLGTVAVTVFGAGTPVSAAGLSLIQQFIAARMPNCISMAGGAPVNAVQLPVYAGGGTPLVAGATVAVTIYGPQSAAAAGRAAAIQAFAALVMGTPVGGYALSSGGTRGLSNSAIVDAITNSSPAITKVVVTVNNYSSYPTLTAPSGAGADLLMPPAAGLPVALTLSQALNPSWTNV